ncbi:MAG: hypothetical protein Q8O19_00480, partial [Rectinemataceae bacterium]|nr:hypothetical protein [Rectinemataceae bacterium]
YVQGMATGAGCRMKRVVPRGRCAWDETGGNRGQAKQGAKQGGETGDSDLFLSESKLFLRLLVSSE